MMDAHGAAYAPDRSKLWLKPSVLQYAADLVAIIASFAVFQILRAVTDPPYPLEWYVMVGGFTIVYWSAILWMGGLYRDFYIRSPFDEVSLIFRQTLLGSALMFFSISMDSSRSVRLMFIAYWAAILLFVILGRLIARRVQVWLRSRRVIQNPTLIIGTPDRVSQMLKNIASAPAWGYAASGVMLVGDMPWEADETDVAVLRSVDEIPSFLQTARVREVIVTIDHSDHELLMNIVALATDNGASVKIEPDLYEILSGQARTMQIYGSPLIEVRTQLMQPWEEVAKRLTDIVASVIGLGLGLPVWTLVAIAVKATSSGPMFFVQERVGKNGRIFRMAKFRSMYVDDRRGPTWTDANDPRVTPVGRFIRKTHLDEIPQLWNVLKGEMSLVGPRPEQPFYVEKFTAMVPYYKHRHIVRPGVTGWWQVKVKSNPESLEEIQQRLRYDFFYIENMSFKLDLEIMVRTVFVMLKGHGRA
ncbi:MAG: sugar transferase [Ignavibacteria bacterium]|jgi:exopolysaccharide biosynthesis polyprenyl glycosylphosphotransferase